MKKALLITLVIFAAASFAMAQIGAAPATDVLGAHLNYGRGCAACHAPHSGAYGNGAAKHCRPHCGQRRPVGPGRGLAGRPNHHHWRNRSGLWLLRDAAWIYRHHPGPQHHPVPELP